MYSRLYNDFLLGVFISKPTQGHQNRPLKVNPKAYKKLKKISFTFQTAALLLLNYYLNQIVASATEQYDKPLFTMMSLKIKRTFSNFTKS